MLDELLKPETIAHIEKLIADVEACYQVNQELSQELINLESKSTVRFSKQNQKGGLGGGSSIAFYAMLPDSFTRENKVLIDNTQASEFALNDAKAELSLAKWAALGEISEASTKEYLMAAKVLKQNHSILYALGNREGKFKMAINCWNKLHIPCNYGTLKVENKGLAGEPVIINQQIAVRHGTTMSKKVNDFMKPLH